jgi:hypothetical protein
MHRGDEFERSSQAKPRVRDDFASSGNFEALILRIVGA